MARVQVQAEHFSVKRRSRDPATCVGSLPAAFCSPADTEVAAGRPKPVSPLKDSCPGLAWPAITRGIEETQTPPSLLGHLRHRGGMLRLGTQPATSGAVCRFKGWDGGWETRPQVELLYGRGAPYPWWEAQGEGALETESQHGWETAGSHVPDRGRVCPWLLLPGGGRGGGKEAGAAPGSVLSLPSLFRARVVLSLWAPFSPPFMMMGLVVSSVKFTP